MRLAVLFLCLIAPVARAADDWQPVATDLLAKHKTGFGGLSGVVVERDTGALFVCLSDQGLFRSADEGKTWERHGEARKGRTETPGCFSLDPTGKTKRALLATVYGGPVLVTATTADAPLRAMDKKSVHVDWCAADWSDPELKFAVAFKHEADGLLLLTRDSGKSFTEVGKGYGLGAWVFDADTAVIARAQTKDNPKGGFVRTADGGKTFLPVNTEGVSVSLPAPRGDALYWLVEGALMKVTDKGKTWEKVSEIKGARYGPVFGKDAKHLFVLTSAGVVESTDAGATWGTPLAVPKELKGVSPLTWLDYDAKNDTLYVMKMGSDLFKLARGK
jgi:hypothetical protein